jgi:uncharacterized membrane protein
VMSGWLFALAFASALGSGLVAGVFFAFSTFVMAALARLPPAQGIAAMQSINVAVINPWFMTGFLGTAAACLVLGVVSLLRWHVPGAGYLLAGALLYLAGTFLVTMIFNVPRNDALAAVEAATASPTVWAEYVRGWTAWNNVRTAAALAAAAAFTLGLLRRGWT